MSWMITSKKKAQETPVEIRKGVTSQKVRVLYLDSRLRGNDEVSKLPVGIRKGESAYGAVWEIIDKEI